MSGTLAVLGLDAADYRLVRQWDCQNLLLDNHQEIQTFSHSLDVPATLEVWPTIATGMMPQEHGVALDQTGWNTKRGLNLLVKAVQLLPSSIHSLLATLKERQFSSGFPQTDASNVFSNGSVYNWPGITECFDWEQEGDWFNDVNDGNLSDQTFYEQVLGSAGKGIGWLRGQVLAEVPIAGVHIHILDHMGHIYAKRPEKLQRIYEVVNQLVGWLREQVDRLVIISDHGMETTATDDSNPGVHSWHALISTTEEGPLPNSVKDVRNWLEDHTELREEIRDATDIDAPKEHLEDLGYL